MTYENSITDHMVNVFDRTRQNIKEARTAYTTVCRRPFTDPAIDEELDRRLEEFFCMGTGTCTCISADHIAVPVELLMALMLRERKDRRKASPFAGGRGWWLSFCLRSAKPLAAIYEEEEGLSPVKARLQAIADVVAYSEECETSPEEKYPQLAQHLDQYWLKTDSDGHLISAPETPPDVAGADVIT
jgi:hypothetical protein